MVIFMLPYKLIYTIMKPWSTVFIVQVSMKTEVLGLQFHWSIILGVLAP